MLGSYMEDIGITPDQFESACGKASIKTTFHQVSFVSVSVEGGYLQMPCCLFPFFHLRTEHILEMLEKVLTARITVCDINYVSLILHFKWPHVY